MKRRVVITGIGSVTAAGYGSESLWHALCQSEPLFTPLDKFDITHLNTRLAAQVPGFNATDWMPRVLARQTDLSTHFALAAVKLGLGEAGINLSEEDPYRIGIMVGQALGGMDYSEANLYNQWFVEPDAVSPYQAIAWFYAAAQGQSSIQFGLKGYCKSFVADRASGLHAIGHGYHTVANGNLEICLAGGTEAPLAPFICLALESTGNIAVDRYIPFSAQPGGMLLGEGACFLILESLEHALARKAPILAEITGYGMATDPEAGAYAFAGAEALYRAMQLAAGREGRRPVGHICADGAATPAADNAEREAINRFIGPDMQTTVSVPKTVIGELYGAGAPLQVAAGALCLHKGAVLPLLSDAQSDYGLPHVSKCQTKPIHSVLVNSRGIGGVAASLLIERYI